MEITIKISLNESEKTIWDKISKAVNFIGTQRTTQEAVAAKTEAAVQTPAITDTAAEPKAEELLTEEPMTEAELRGILAEKKRQLGDAKPIKAVLIKAGAKTVADLNPNDYAKIAAEVICLEK